VEELCFFFHPRSIDKVVEISESAQAKRVKILVFEDVRIASWNRQVRNHVVGENALRKGAVPAVESAGSEYENLQYAFREKDPGELLGDALLRFSNLKGIHSHAGFKGMRPLVPTLPLPILLESGRLSHRYMENQLWDDRAALRIRTEAGDENVYETAEDSNDHVSAY
jgi:hypothetical protein